MLGLLVPAAWAEPADAPARVTAVTVQSVDDTITVSIATAGAPAYRTELLGGPFRVVLDFDNTLYEWRNAPTPVAADPVKEIRGSQYKKGVARLVIELTRKALYKIEPEAGGIRVVFAPPTKAAQPAVTAPAAPAPAVMAPIVPAPPAPAPTTRAPATSAPATPAMSSTWRLHGTIVSNGASIAYIADPGTNQVRRYVVGDRIGGGLVQAIEDRRVVLKMPQGEIELKLEERRPTPTPE